MQVSVIIPAYKRPKLLLNCLDSLVNQLRKPDIIYITAQEWDLPVIEEVRKWQKKHDQELRSELIIVHKTGQSHAMNQAIRKIEKGIVCFIDDDAEAEPDWIEKIEGWYKDDTVGGVGGFIHQHSEGTIDTGVSDVVGKVTWYGKVIGLHHYRIPEVKAVTFFKGCNMSFRRDCLSFSDENLTFEQFYDEVDVGLSAKEKGYKLIFDPSIKVTHYDSPQFYIAERRELKPNRIWSNNYNYVYVMAKHFKFPHVIAILFYSFILMRTIHSGFVPFLVEKAIKGRPSWDIFWAAFQGKLSGISGYLRWRKMNL
jgi:GT2 family glycosyltransferase